MKTFYATLIVSILLLVAGFLCPPIGVIDGSVLSAVGLLLMFATLAKLPEAIRSAKNCTIRHGESSIEVTTRDEEQA